MSAFSRAKEAIKRKAGEDKPGKTKNSCKSCFGRGWQVHVGPDGAKSQISCTCAINKALREKWRAEKAKKLAAKQVQLAAGKV